MVAIVGKKLAQIGAARGGWADSPGSTWCSQHVVRRAVSAEAELTLPCTSRRKISTTSAGTGLRDHPGNQCASTPPVARTSQRHAWRLAGLILCSLCVARFHLFVILNCFTGAPLVGRGKRRSAHHRRARGVSGERAAGFRPRSAPEWPEYLLSGKLRRHFARLPRRRWRYLGADRIATRRRTKLPCGLRPASSSYRSGRSAMAIQAVRRVVSAPGSAAGCPDRGKGADALPIGTASLPLSAGDFLHRLVEPHVSIA